MIVAGVFNCSYHLEMANQKKRSSRGAFALSRDYVTSEDIFRLETERVFGQHWICLNHISQFDINGVQPVQFEQHRLLVVGDGSRFKVFRNFCRHRGSQLVTEGNCSGIGHLIQCPYHAWTYDRNGKLVGAPNMEGQEPFDRDQFGLVEVDGQSYGGFLWINLNPSSSVQDFLSPIGSQFDSWRIKNLKVGAELEYHVQANWKLIFQNYSECYHCPTVHPTLNRLTPYKGSSNDVISGPILGGPMQLAGDCKTMSTDGMLVASHLPGLNQEQRRCINYYTIFPTIFLSTHPDYVLIHLLERIAVDQTKVTCQFLFSPDETGKSEFDPSRAVQFWDMTNRQDWEVCQLAQAGMEDPAYTPGPYSDLESVLAAFDGYYFEVMERND